MKNDITIIRLLKRLYWDILDPNERKYYLYWLIKEIPGIFGNLLRARYLSKKFKHAGKNITIYSGTMFRSMENLCIGDNSQIGHDNFIQALGGVSIGDNVSTAPGVKIWSVNHNYNEENRLIGKQGQTKQEVVIGNDVWIASNVFIMPGVHLPDGIVVSAGSVVGVKSYKPYCLIAGNPARIIGYRGNTNSEKE